MQFVSVAAENCYSNTISKRTSKIINAWYNGCVLFAKISTNSYKNPANDPKGGRHQSLPILGHLMPTFTATHLRMGGKKAIASLLRRNRRANICGGVHCLLSGPSTRKSARRWPSKVQDRQNSKRTHPNVMGTVRYFYALRF